MGTNWQQVRSQFPQLGLKIKGEPYVYLDSAATTLKPQRVIDRLTKFYQTEVSNVHRGAHLVSHEATLSYEGAREKICQFLNGNESSEIVFTRGTTESLNLVAHIASQQNLNEGDEILLTHMEHHSNIIPWQLLAERKKLKIKYIPLTAQGDLDLAQAAQLFSEKTKIVSLCHVSNTLGTTNDVEAIGAMSRDVGALYVIDAAQSVSVCTVDVQKIKCDFLAFSGHKLFAPFGVGILWGRKKLLDQAQPYQGGGSMIDQVKLQSSSFLPSPQRFEAGTPNVAGAVALAEAIDFVTEIGVDQIAEHEVELVRECEKQLSEISDLTFYGQSETKVNVVSFGIKGIHPSDLSQILDQQGVAVRSGHHCTQILMNELGISGTVRASFSLYNNKEDVDKLTAAVIKAKEMLL